MGQVHFGICDYKPIIVRLVHSLSFSYSDGKYAVPTYEYITKSLFIVTETWCVSYTFVSHFISGMDSTDISILSLLILFANADVQHTNFTARHDYSIHDCSQLLPCGPLKMLKMQSKVACAMQALQTGVDMFMYENGNKSCLLCLQRSPSDGITVVPGSQLVYVKGMWDMPKISNVITARFAYGIF